MKILIVDFTEWIKKNWMLIVSILINIVLIICISRACTSKPETIIKTNTVTVNDTIVIEKEKIVLNTKIKYVNIVDTFWVNKKDTIIDTVFVQVPIYYKEYKDTISTDSSRTEVFIKHHGYLSEIDQVSISNYYIKQLDNIYKEKKSGFGYSIGFTVNCGLGAGIENKSIYIGPQITCGIGVTWGYSKITK